MRLLFALVANVLKLLFLPFSLVRRERAAPRGAFLAVEIDGTVTDVAPPFRFWQVRTKRPSLTLHGLASAIDVMLDDPAPRGLLVTIKSLKAGMATAKSLRDQLARVRAAGREVVVHLPVGADTRELYVATAASRLFVGPHTSLSPLGFAVNARYFRRALDKAGLTPEVFARGTYKSAGETFMRDSMSDAQREQLDAILTTWHDALVAAIAEGRKLDEARARELVDGAPWRAAEAVKNGLADAEAYDDQVEELLAAGERVRIVPIARYVKRRRAGTLLPIILRPPVIGIVRVHGAIAAASPMPLPLAADEPLIHTLRTARQDRRIRGVILHIDSPGGSALASDRIHRELELLAAEKPLVACMANTAASGGYYVAAPAHVIVAEPTTVTGSIGVIAARFTPEPLLSRLGIATSSVKKGAHAGLLDATGELTEDERAAIHREIEDTYQAFVGVVAAGRKKTHEEVDAVAEGRVWTGAAALGHGLVDKLGGFDVALAEARTRIGDTKGRARAVVMRAPRVPVPALARPKRIDARVLFELLEAFGVTDASALALALATSSKQEHILTWFDAGPLG